MLSHHRHLLLTLAVAAISAAAASSDPSPPTFNWSSIAPSDDVEYHDCYDHFKCARLNLPLDWKNESDHRQVTLAMIKLPAVVPEDDPTFRGAIFSNPGGPGGSGVQFALTDFHGIQSELADVPGRQHYEIISWDPRGIGDSRPLADCFRSNHFARTNWNFEARGAGDVDTGRHAITYGLGISGSLAYQCKEVEETQGHEVMRYVNTPSVARDMVAMLDKIEELRQRELSNKHGVNGNSQLKTGARDGQANKDEKPRLQYLGYSYGTLLGNYFASLFPERVGRLILDGVANAQDYATGPGWLTNLDDTDKTFTEFWEGCFKAGADVCPFVHTDKSASAAQNRFWDWIEDLNEVPVPIPHPNGGIMVLASGDVRSMIGIDLYDPISTFIPLAKMLHDSMCGNYTTIANRLLGTLPQYDDTCPVKDDPGYVVANNEAGSAVLCSDGDDVTMHNASWWQWYSDKETSLSRVYGAWWAGNLRFVCSRWPFKPNWTFKGPFTTPPVNPADPATPAAPILFLSNRLDPVTPLQSARDMSKEHPGSAVVVLDALGHTTSYGGKSGCLFRITRDYLYNGTVPAHETLCKPKCGPWDSRCQELKKRSTVVNSGGGVTRRRRSPLGLY